MIEITTSEVDGVRFYKGIRILEPDDRIGGFPIHFIPDVAVRDPELMRAIKVLGLKRVGRDLPSLSELYAQFPRAYIGVKLTQFMLSVYWGVIRWLYDNARVFKEIPPYEHFSWQYFTPYVWCRKVRELCRFINTSA